MLMASLTKFSFILREVRTVVNLRLNQCHVNRLCTHSTAVGNATAILGGLSYLLFY